MITLTDSAFEKACNLTEDYIRLSLKGGGCSGFEYQFTFEDEENVSEDDEQVRGILLVDPVSLMYLDGSTIDLRTDAMGESLVISNPNATQTCGCGSSFTI